MHLPHLKVFSIIYKIIANKAMTLSKDVALIGKRPTPTLVMNYAHTP